MEETIKRKVEYAVERRNAWFEYTEAEEKELEKESYSKSSQLGMLQYLLGIQYSYQDDKKEAEKWLKKAKNNAKGTPLEKEIKKIKI